MLLISFAKRPRQKGSSELMLGRSVSSLKYSPSRSELASDYYLSVCVCVPFLVRVGSSKSGQLPVKCAFRLMQSKHFGSFGSGSCSELSGSELGQLRKSGPIPTLFSLAFSL